MIINRLGIDDIGMVILAYNIFCFLYMGWDKRQARKHRRRVPEARLFLLSALLGAPGILAGMIIFHHKIKHPSFQFGIPALLLLNAIMVTGYIVFIP